MDVFALRQQLVADYSEYTRSFLRFNDDRIKERVDEELEAGLLWPEPLVQLNPSYEPGGLIDDLLMPTYHSGVLQRSSRKNYVMHPITSRRQTTTGDSADWPDAGDHAGPRP